MKYSSSVAKVICSGLEEGLSIKSVCGIANISVTTYYRWIEAHEEFRDAVHRTQAVFERNALGAIKRAGDKDWKAWSWLLERRYPSEWKNSKDVHLVKSDDGSNQVIDFLKQAMEIDE
jgi:hypothetical protein